MENSYGIGITNRYDLFCMDDDANEPLDSILTKKAKQQKKAAAAAAKTAVASSGTGKENKVDATVIKSLQGSAVKGAHQQNGQPPKPTRPIKETQNIRTNADKGPREDKPKETKPFERNSASNNKQNGETREQRYNRRNRDEANNKPQSAQQYNGNTTNNQGNSNNNQSEQNSNSRNDDRPPRRTGNNAGGNDRRGGDGPRRPYEGRGGKREFDRQSGSEKTGVKAIDKREGGGAHNWGTHKQDIEDLNKTNLEWDPEKEPKEDATGEGNANKEETEAQVPAEEETKEITLDEWKAQRAVRAKPQFNIRKAGEGEDTSQWKKMIALQNRKKKEDDNSDDELEYDPSMYPQRVGRQKHVLDIEFHFNDGRRGGGMNRGRGRPRPGGPNNAGERGDRRGPNRNRMERHDNDGVERAEGGDHRPPPRGERPQRDRRDDDRRERRGPYGEDRRAGHGQHLPKVDDENHFPSLN